MKTIVLARATLRQAALCLLLGAPLLSSCEKPVTEPAAPVQTANTQQAVTVQNGRLVFKDSHSWSEVATRLINLPAEELATWQRKFKGFEPLDAAAVKAALANKPDGEHAVQAYFLAMLNKNAMYQIGPDVFIYGQNTLYWLKNPDEATVGRVREQITAGSVTPSATLEVLPFQKHAPKSMQAEGATTAARPTYVYSTPLEYDGVQHQWYQGSNFYFKYRTRFFIYSSYPYAGKPTAEVGVVNRLEYSKAGQSSWKQAGENANKAFSAIRISWWGTGQPSSGPYLPGAYMDTSGEINLPDVSTSGNWDLVSSTVILASHFSSITLTGSVSNSVNWNTSQSSQRNLYYNYSDVQVF